MENAAGFTCSGGDFVFCSCLEGGEELLLYAQEESAEIHLWRQRASDTDDNLLLLVIHCHKERRLVHLRAARQIFSS